MRLSYAYTRSPCMELYMNQEEVDFRIVNKVTGDLAKMPRERGRERMRDKAIKRASRGSPEQNLSPANWVNVTA